MGDFVAWLDGGAMGALMAGGPAIWAIAALSVVLLALILWKSWRLTVSGAFGGMPADAFEAAEAGSGRGLRGRFAGSCRRAMREMSESHAREEITRIAKRELAEARSGLRAIELIALIAPLFYGLEGNVVARWGTAGLSPIEVLHGASILGALIALPLAVASGQFIDPRGPWGARDAAVLGSAIIHVLVYTSYVWMVGAAGAIFAVQVSYLVTAFGVLWAMLILGESYSAWVWGATLIILTGVFLVQPRPREALAEDEAPATIGPNPR